MMTQTRQSRKSRQDRRVLLSNRQELVPNLKKDVIKLSRLRAWRCQPARSLAAHIAGYFQKPMTDSMRPAAPNVNTLMPAPRC